MKRIRSLLLAIFTLLLSIWLLLFYSVWELSVWFYISIALLIPMFLFFIDSILGKDK